MSELTNKVDAIFAPWDKTNSPGCALAVLQDGEIIYKRGYGMANLDYDLAIRTDSVFHIASISKQFAAFSIALLAQEGKLSIGDDIRKHLPEMPDYGDIITIRHLVHHTSGLRDQWELLYMAGWRENDLKTNDDVLYLASRQKELNFRPGDEYLYSNTGYTLLGIIVERVSGQTLRAFTTERIFNPLGMKNTHFHDDFEMVVKNRAYGYMPRPEGGYRISIPLFDTVGATSLFTTVEDLALWEQNFYHKRIGGAEIINLMRKPAVLNNGEELDYAFGLRVAPYRGLRTFGHSGADAGYRSDFLCFPDQRFAVIIFCNLGTMNPGELSKRVADLYLEEQFTEPLPQEDPIELSEEEVARFAGLYVDHRTGDTRLLDMRDGKLGVQFAPEFRLDFVPVAPNRFKALAFPVYMTFEESESGGWRIQEVFGSGKPTLYEGVEAVRPTREQLKDYAGDYYSSELNTTYTIALADTGLVMRHFKRRDIPLQPTITDAFAGRGDLQFTRDTAGNVDGFTWFTGRIRRQRFDRVKA